MTLRKQLFLLQSVIMLIVIVGTGITVAVLQENQLRQAYKDRMFVLAEAVAENPAFLDAFDDPDPSAVIQPLAELIRKAADVDYVVVSDAHGIRFSHPDPARIGERVSTNPDALDGKPWAGTQSGTLGLSWRVKMPVKAADGEIIGQVSVGILEADMRSDYLANIPWLALALAAAAVLGVLLSSGAAQMIRKRIYGLEPDEIKSMLDTRDATLHGIGDGIVVVGLDGVIQLSNDAAIRLLGKADSVNLVGSLVTDVLDVDLHPAERGVPQQLALAGERVLVARVDPVVVDGRDVGTVIILMDRTEIDSALRDLAGAQSLAEVLRAQQHEFANTLYTLGGLMDLGEVDAARRMIERSAHADNDHGGFTAGIDDIELAALLLAKRARARELGVSLEIDADAAVSPTIDESRDRITILGNLVDNAVEAVGSGGHVIVGFFEDDEDLVITVDDDGPGIPAAERESVFNLEYSSKAHASALPRGYGLTLVARVVERVSGEVIVGESPWGGARFTVRLPRATDVEVMS